MASRYDEVVSDSEEEQEMTSFEKSQRAEISSFGSLSAGRIPTVDTSNVSYFTESFLANTRKSILLSSGSPMDALSSVNSPAPTGSRPRPRPAYKGPNAASNTSIINPASSESHNNGVTSIINDFTLDVREKPVEDISLETSISERAKLRQRKATKPPQPSEPLPAPSLPLPPPKPKAKPAPKARSKAKAKTTLFDEVIELTSDDDDEIALRSPRFPPLKETGTLTPEHTVPIATSSLAPAPSSQLPPSDPPLSTFPGIPPIITLGDPDTSLDVDEAPQSPLFSPKKRKRADAEERRSMPPPPPPLSSSSIGNTTSLLDTTADTSLGDNIILPEVATKKKPKTTSKKKGKQKKGVNEGVEGEEPIPKAKPKAKAGKKKVAAVEVVIPPAKIRSPGRNQRSDGAKEIPPAAADASNGPLDDQNLFGGSDLSGLSESEDIGSSKKTRDAPASKSKKRKATNEIQEDEPVSKRPTPPRDEEEEDVFGDVVGKKTKGKGKRILMSDDDGDPDIERVLTPPLPPPKGRRRARAKDVVAGLPSSSPREDLVTGSDKKENVRPEPETPRSPPLKSNLRAPSATLKSTPMSELIRRVNSLPGSPFPPTPTLGRTASPLSHTTAYSPYLKSSRSALSRIAPLHPHRKPPPPPLPKPPPPKKTKKQLDMEERWEEELSESVEGWAAMSDEERALLRRQKRDMEMGIED